MSRRIGVNGGTFDPVHFGHLRPALEVLRACRLDEMRFIPCHVPVHRGAPHASATQRAEMVRRAIAPIPQFVLDTRELARNAPSYMVETLESLRTDFPGARLVLMMGQDAFAAFDRWHRWEDILELAALVVTRRPGAPAEVPAPLRSAVWTGALADLPSAGAVGMLEVTQLDISSTAIRRLRAAGEPIDFLTPQAVVEYMASHRLYEDVTDA